MIQAEDYDSQSGTQLTGGGATVGYINNGDWLAFNGMDFGDGFDGLKVRWASNTSGGTLELRLGSATGTLVDNVTLGGTDGWTTWTEQTFDINALSGTQDLYLVFTGPTGYLFDLDWIELL
jgi:hypothetical protein